MEDLFIYLFQPWATVHFTGGIVWRGLVVYVNLMHFSLLLKLKQVSSYLANTAGVLIRFCKLLLESYREFSLSYENFCFPLLWISVLIVLFRAFIYLFTFFGKCRQMSLRYRREKQKSGKRETELTLGVYNNPTLILKRIFQSYKAKVCSFFIVTSMIWKKNKTKKNPYLNSLFADLVCWIHFLKQTIFLKEI